MLSREITLLLLIRLQRLDAKSADSSGESSSLSLDIEQPRYRHIGLRVSSDPAVDLHVRYRQHSQTVHIKKDCNCDIKLIAAVFSINEVIVFTLVLPAMHDILSSPLPARVRCPTMYTEPRAFWGLEYPIGEYCGHAS